MQQPEISIHPLIGRLLWEYVKEFSEKTFNEGAVDEILSVIDSVVGIMIMIHKYVLDLNE